MKLIRKGVHKCDLEEFNGGFGNLHHWYEDQEIVQCECGVYYQVFTHGSGNCWVDWKQLSERRLKKMGLL